MICACGMVMCSVAEIHFHGVKRVIQMSIYGLYGLSWSNNTFSFIDDAWGNACVWMIPSTLSYSLSWNVYLFFIASMCFSLSMLFRACCLISELTMTKWITHYFLSRSGTEHFISCLMNPLFCWHTKYHSRWMSMTMVALFISIFVDNGKGRWGENGGKGTSGEGVSQLLPLYEYHLSQRKSRRCCLEKQHGTTLTDTPKERRKALDINDDCKDKRQQYVDSCILCPTRLLYCTFAQLVPFFSAT